VTVTGGGRSAFTDLDVAVVGAGVVGLAVAAEVAARFERVAVFERHAVVGSETSSRNSEVIHAGIYYPAGSLKARSCVEGSRMLYALCTTHGVPFRKCGKLVVAFSDADMPTLLDLSARGRGNGVEGLRVISSDQVLALEPGVRACAALLSPETGIVDSHRLMATFLGLARDRGAAIVLAAPVVGLQATRGAWRIRYRDAAGDDVVTARAVVNAAGLGAPYVMHLAGLEPEAAGLRLHLCKGEYFAVMGAARSLVRGLVYPPPTADLVGLGIHAVVDLAGGLRLGPNAFYVDEIDYAVDPSHADAFFEGVRSFLPGLRRESLAPALAGIRPKLAGPGEAARDFYVAHEDARGAPGLFNLLGIESPGLTASPYLARLVAEMVASYFGP
jgi:L-2-hydroxyglutarate oxidase LhgO